MKIKDEKGGAAGWLRENRLSCIVLLCAALLFVLLWSWAAPEPEEDPGATEYAEYERARITAVLADSTEADPNSDGACRGDQLLLAEVISGQYRGETLQVYNYVGPLYGGPVQEGDKVVLIVSTYADGSHTATVFEYDRRGALVFAVVLFLLAAVLVGGKTGAKSLVGLGITLACLFWILLPLLLKGAPTLPTVFFICIYVTVVSLTILGGIRKKTVCATLGTVAGTGLAMLFGILVQSLSRIDGLRLSDVEPLLQLRQQGIPIGLTGLLTGGIVISALGAVMDVAMSMASSLSEIHAANPALGKKALFRSGMNVGRDMVGTMTNTLILAFLGSGFTLILYLYSLGLSHNQLFSSAYFATEVISGISSSIGMILSIPITAIISAAVLTKEK